ncbi:MAG: prepilin-type N-terminal cleavage/methylation domain-containing protein, partial [Candidatus Colwellbacteria bacterium]|nr:prepilin-type N-terminal cleavage/methylation domain-containing protein [Candidatus Colwellbacteria bacterium]
MNKKTAFTLVELLIVIAILAVLAAAVVIVLNPAELLAQAR